jgi:hypothetical protein
MATDLDILKKYKYRRRLPHIQADASMFITFCTLGRMILPEPARDLVLQHCLREGGVSPFAGEGARATSNPVYFASSSAATLIEPPVTFILRCQSL